MLSPILDMRVSTMLTSSIPKKLKPIIDMNKGERFLLM